MAVPSKLCSLLAFTCLKCLMQLIRAEYLIMCSPSHHWIYYSSFAEHLSNHQQQHQQCKHSQPIRAVWWLPSHRKWCLRKICAMFPNTCPWLCVCATWTFIFLMFCWLKVLLTQKSGQGLLCNTFVLSTILSQHSPMHLSATIQLKISIVKSHLVNPQARLWMAFTHRCKSLAT